MYVGQVQTRSVRGSVLFLLLLAAAALGVGLLGPVDSARSAGEPWDGKWETNWGTVRFFQDGRDIDGNWECNCPDGRKAVITGRASELADGIDGIEGNWRCPGAGPAGRGTFSIFADFMKKKRFRGSYSVKGPESDAEKWVGDKE